MFLIILALICALTISGVAIFYSVIGLGAIFAAAKVPIYIMGGVLEVAKLVTASWLYQNWNNIPFLLKTYLTTAVGILMIITSLGIFGFLSKAHVEQSTPAAETVAKIDRINEQILRQESTITNLTSKIDRLQGGGATANVDDQIDREQKIIDNADEKIAGEVTLIQKKIDNVQKQIDDIQTDADKKILLDFLKNQQTKTSKTISLNKTEPKLKPKETGSIAITRKKVNRDADSSTLEEKTKKTSSSINFEEIEKKRLAGENQKKIDELSSSRNKCTREETKETEKIIETLKEQLVNMTKTRRFRLQPQTYSVKVHVKSHKQSMSELKLRCQMTQSLFC